MSPIQRLRVTILGTCFRLAKGLTFAVLLLEFNKCLRKVELFGSENEHLDARLSKSFSYCFCLVLSRGTVQRSKRTISYGSK